MRRQRLSRDEWAEQTAQRIEAAQRRIESAVAQLQSGAQWRDYLVLQSRLHSYSARNVCLLWQAMGEAYAKGLVPTPVPTYVAGFRAWKALGRSVCQGQHGLQILAPNRRSVQVAVSPDGSSRALERDVQPRPGERVERRQLIRGFRIEHVWAAEQTAGDPLPQPPTPRLLAGQAPEGLWESVTEQIDSLGFAVRLVPDADHLGGANGRTTWDSRLVEVRADMDPAARAKTALHELGHCLLHDPSGDSNGTHGARSRSRAVMEVEAESMAFIVADAHGLSTDDYSFPYVATWAGEDGLAAVQSTASRVATAAQRVIAASGAQHTTGGRVPDPTAAAAPNRRDVGTPEPCPPEPAAAPTRGVDGLSVELG